MDWIKLVIPLIAVAVWIVSHLANQKQEARRPPGGPPPPRPRTPPPPRVSAQADEDQYRVEMDRERQPLKAAKVVKQQPKARVKIPTLVRRPIPGPTPAQGPRSRVPPSESEPILASLAPADVTLNPLVTNLGQVGALTADPAPRLAKKLRGLLTNRDNLATAMMLREILDVPVSRRPRR